jgi:hypothetical protein
MSPDRVSKRILSDEEKAMIARMDAINAEMGELLGKLGTGKSAKAAGKKFEAAVVAAQGVIEG